MAQRRHGTTLAKALMPCDFVGFCAAIGCIFIWGILGDHFLGKAHGRRLLPASAAVSGR
ncbi:MAG: hypothetical protein LBB38_03910 [Puniceicoccales bacterium]|nr:hypothetical protein [Puniceicoccales bacterium]